MNLIIPQKKSNEISFLFGGIDDDTYEMVEIFAINHSISFDNAKFRYFNLMRDEFGVPKNSEQNYYQALFREMTQRKVLLPKICHGIYKENGNVYPKIILTNNFVVDIKTNEKCLFTNPYLINRFGKNLGEDIGFEYLKFEGVLMASIHEASCACGFGTSFTVGGTRQNFMKNGPFPFYCGNCGLISVNTRNERLVCEKCNSENIQPYGVEATSLPSNAVLPAIQFFNYKAYSKGNICPSCKQMTLEFKSAGIRFC